MAVFFIIIDTMLFVVTFIVPAMSMTIITAAAALNGH